MKTITEEIEDVEIKISRLKISYKNERTTLSCFSTSNFYLEAIEIIEEFIVRLKESINENK